MNDSKTNGKKLGHAAVFLDSIKRRVLLKKVYIHTSDMKAIKITLKEIYNRKNKQWVICTNSQSSIKTIEIIQY